MIGSFSGYQGILAGRILSEEADDATVELVPERSGTGDWRLLQTFSGQPGPRIILEAGGASYSLTQGGQASSPGIVFLQHPRQNLGHVTTITTDAPGGAISYGIASLTNQTASVTTLTFSSANALLTGAQMRVGKLFGINETVGARSGQLSTGTLGLAAVDPFDLEALDQSPSRAAWQDEARTEVLELLEDLRPKEKAALSELAGLVLDECARLPISSPAIDLDSEANVELFWRTGNEGLLAIVRADRTLHFFGSSDGESWRSSYSLSGSVWRSHLKLYLKPMCQNAECA